MEKDGIHVGIICDGNRRWTKGFWKKFADLSPVDGHKQGFRAIVDRIIPALSEGKYVKVEELTLYAFSTENWSRPPEEVQALMKFIRESISQWVPELQEKGIQLVHAGDMEDLREKDQALAEALEKAMKETKNGVKLRLNICLNYGGKNEIARAATKVANKKIQATPGVPIDISEDEIDAALDIPRPLDLMIRTGGEQRVSNFLLQQIAYGEMIFSKVFLPSIRKKHVRKWLKDFVSRDKRFGGNSSHNPST